ncbi:MAG: NAD(P)-binding domain-containing protein [Longimicrobiales bacterium]|nr:NAD(P)-binding domain-containing protein [Longimicrobiales bacterium]
MKIAVMGRGSVGSTLGRAWSSAGHHVRYGRQVPDAADERIHEDAASWADVVVLATPASVAETLASTLSVSEGAVVIDCTNPLLPGLAGLDHADASGGERIGEAMRGAKVFKAFNSVGANIMADPVLEGRRAMMLFCGPGRDEDPDAVDVVAGLIEDVGFDAVHVGPLARAPHLEHLAYLWIRMSVDTDLGRDFAFGLLRR